MKKILFGVLIGVGLLAGMSVVADYNPFEYIGGNGYFFISKYYDKDSNVVCYLIGDRGGISCLKNN